MAGHQTEIVTGPGRSAHNERYGNRPLRNVARPSDGRVNPAQRWVIDVLLPVPFWMMAALGGAANSVS